MGENPESGRNFPAVGAGGSSVGGAAAIYGFVHQILASIGQLVRAQFGSIGAKTDPNTIIAILEPSAGGDLSLEAAARKVIQFKHRAKSVSISDVGGKVLPDLYRAHLDREAAEYTLNTTNGVSKPTLALIQSLKAYASGDATARKKIAINEHVKGALARLREIYAASGAELAAFDISFSTFISRFTVAPRMDAEQARAEAIRFLNKRVPYAEKGEQVLDTLVGHLADKARRNDARISVDNLLSRLGLPGAHAGHSDAASARLATALAGALTARKFDPVFDIRAPILMAPTDPLTLVSGNSGCGKSWVLYRLAAALAESGKPTVLIRAADREELERQLRLTIGAGALALEQPLEASVLGQTWRRMQDAPDATIPILWEGCRDAAVLESIRLAGGLGPGLPLVAEFPVAQEARLEEFAQVPIHRVGEFSPTQLFEALDKRGVSAGHVPREIRRMLRLPVLCGIYATLALELEHWDPQTEYRVLEDFWDRAKHRAGKLAGTRLKALAKSLVAKRRSALTDDEIVALGFSETELDLLIAAGWLSNVGDRWSFAHDRLLTWAIAIALAGDFENGVIDAATLAGEVSALDKRDDADKTKLSGLGFLLMDVVWLISGLSGRTKDAVDFVEQFESEYRTGAHTLYAELLPTAGSRIVGVLEERAARVTTGDVPIKTYLTEAFLALPLVSEAREPLLARLWSGDKAGRSIAISLGARWPLTAQRDDLWQNYCDLNRDREAKRFDYDLFERMEAALKLLVRADPAWLGRLIEAEDGQEELRLAALLLKSLETAVGSPIWHQVREKMLQIIPDDRQAVVMECLARFGDASDREMLERKIKAGDRSASYAMEALAEIDVDAALRAIEQKPPQPSLPYSRYWLDRLLDHDPGRTAAALRDWLIAGDPSGGKLASLWHGIEGRIDPDTIVLLLDRLEALIEVPTPKQGRDPRRDLLTVLGSLTLDPVHDSLFEARRNTALSAAIAKRAIAHFDGTHDDDDVAVRRLLRRIGGAEYERLVIHALSPEDLGRAHSGITSSIFCPTDTVVARLEKLVEVGVTPDGNDDALLDLWRMLLAIDPATWRPRLLALLLSDDQRSIMLGLRLIPEFAAKGDEAAVLACFETSAPGNAVTARAMQVAIEIGDPAEAMVARALEEIQAAESGDASTTCLNVLLNDRSEAARTALDAYLAPLETAKSWKSHDSQALAIRLSQGGASPELWRAGFRMMHGTWFSGDRFLDVVLDHDRPRAMDVLLDQAFAAPATFVNAQPDAIKLLAKVDRPLATQAFVQSWNDHPRRRQHLAESVRRLEDSAFYAMIATLGEEFRVGQPTQTYRAICVELRRARDRAWPLLLKKFDGASAAERVALCSALGWTAGQSHGLLPLIEAETDNEVRRELYHSWRHWRQVEAAVAQFREARSLKTMEYAIEFGDPAPLCGWEDPLRIIEAIGGDDRLIVFAERQFAVRFNKVRGSKLRRVVVRKSPGDE
ncbi:hypothetical protein RFM68_15495 [Mesorhizobium sp. MSK_1335]|uniref:ATP-binding protein n=1 Tax=Mesorhizobium montanum TaxID=3072323 RepID=A0ABU4ZMP1_9HYPH|nr:hypothetical protein [Mesorhizobium sp. MSK_1335]MDX8525912.1 hypothetical protein [Mesorhizobium sp. MSK_1335]